MDTPRICGDLPKLANVPDLCEWRHERFETDAWGWRNDKATWQSEPPIMIFGDSFAFGQGVSQELKPSVQLAELLGRPVYDGAAKTELNYLRWLLDHRKRPPERLVFFYMERQSPSEAGLKAWDRKIDENSRLEALNIWWKDVSRYNPLEILVSRFDKSWLTPGLWPNRYEKSFPAYHLRGGRPILFNPESVAKFGDPRRSELPRVAGFFKGLRRLCESRGVRLTILLIPEKYSVYAGLLEDPAMPAGLGPAYLDLLAETLQGEGLDVVSALPAFQAEAAKALESGKLIYWSDDTHWNPEGIRLAMTLVAERLKRGTPTGPGTAAVASASASL
jgi:hypothetical protein